MKLIMKNNFKGVMQMMLNIKARLKNKTFLISASVLIVALVYRVLSLFDIIPTASENEILELISMAVNILALVGVVVCCLFSF